MMQVIYHCMYSVSQVHYYYNLHYNYELHARLLFYSWHVRQIDSEYMGI